MADVGTNLQRAQRAGYDVLGHFALPLSDWRAYFDPIQRRIADLRPEYEDDASAQAVFEHQKHEIGILERCAGSYTYVFYLLQRS